MVCSKRQREVKNTLKEADFRFWKLRPFVEKETQGESKNLEIKDLILELLHLQYQLDNQTELKGSVWEKVSLAFKKKA